MTDNYQYLLDTNMLSELVKNPTGAVANNVRNNDPATLCTSIIVACELRFGTEKKQSPKLTLRVEELLNNIAILPLNHGVDFQYAKIRHQLEKNGLAIGPNDLLIASHALTLGLSLITANMEEFSRVPNLLVANWLDIHAS